MRRWLGSLALTALSLAPRPMRGQTASPADSAPSLRDAGRLAHWIELSTTFPGRERSLESTLRSYVGGGGADAIGNFVVRRGTGSPRRVVACGLDRAAYVVSEITAEGYLRVHGIGDVRHHPLWDQFHEGQRVAVHAANGSAPQVRGVMAVRSTHLWRRRTADSTIAPIESLWVDVGAKSRAEALSLGVRVLDPVRRDLPPWRYGDLVGAPAAAAAAGCLAVAEASRRAPARGETVFILSAQSSFRYTGLAAALAPIGRIDSLFVVDPVLARDSTTGVEEVVTRRRRALPFPLPRSVGTPPATAIGVRSYFQGTLVESVRSADLDELEDAVARAAGVSPPARRGESRPLDVARISRPAAGPAKSLDALLAALTDAYGVSGHEVPVRDAVRGELLEWAKRVAAVDTAGDLIVAAGPDRDTVVFVAHLDEIGFEVTRIASDGTVALSPRGGFFNALWEGQPALLHLDARSAASPAGAVDYCARASSPSALRGVFVPRASATAKQPAAMSAWFGVDSAALVAAGAGVGSSVTGFKCAVRLAGSRFAARSIDDRAGCAALILAMREIDPARLRHKVIFAFSVREETALAGAAAMAARFGSSVKRVHAVDTFVSSDSPRESPRFAHAPLGAGAVIRALDNSSVTPPAEIDRVVATAEAAGIPLQVGVTNGGNDGSELARYGAVDVPLAWPLRYSHSPAEVADLRDILALARLVAALAKADR